MLFELQPIWFEVDNRVSLCFLIIEESITAEQVRAQKLQQAASIFTLMFDAKGQLLSDAKQANEVLDHIGEN